MQAFLQAKFAKSKRLDLVILAVTSILENGTIIYAGGVRTAWAYEAFPNDDDMEYSLQKNVLSRKQQILPMITKVINTYIGG